jgi:flagellar hook-length control protein FliK
MKVNQEAIKSNQFSMLKNLGESLSSKNIGNLLAQKELYQNNSELQNRTLNEGLKTILSELFQNAKSDKILLNITKNSAIFKTFEHFGNEAKKLTELLINKDIKNFDPLLLKSFFMDIENFDEKKFKSIIEKSILTSDIKNLLTSLIDNEDKEIQKQATKMLTQMEYFQLNSYLNNSLYTYLPIEWEKFEGGDIEFKKEGAKQYSCTINLELKEYGKVKINFLYDEENHISIGFFLDNNQLKEKMSESLPSLRKNLKEIGIFVLNISLMDTTIQDERVHLFENLNTQVIGLDLTV